jgi:hypothetical protein
MKYSRCIFGKPQEATFVNWKLYVLCLDKKVREPLAVRTGFF